MGVCGLARPTRDGCGAGHPCRGAGGRANKGVHVAEPRTAGWGSAICSHVRVGSHNWSCSLPQSQFANPPTSALPLVRNGDNNVVRALPLGTCP